MIPVKLVLHNFMSYGEEVTPLDFAEFSIACLTGQNGHGKSALLDAITWALWGEARKAAAAKKPDEGLLRLGASEMRVEFVFDLEGERFRVIRSFRKAGRTNKSGLDLHVYQPERAEFISLSGSSQTETQQKINQFMRMDHSTFINSAFLLQGRADEFTKKSATERKKILAEILGLSKYDELAAIAKEQHNQVRDLILALEGEQQALQPEADALEHWVQKFGQANEAVNAAKLALEQLEQEQALLEQHLRSLQVSEMRAQELSNTIRRQQAEISSLAIEIQELEQSLQQDNGILADQAKILADYNRLKLLEEERAEMNQRLQQARQLEQQVVVCQGAVAAAKLSLEKDIEAGKRQLGWLQDELVAVNVILERQDEILLRHNNLQSQRQLVDRLENDRVHHETLQSKMRDLELVISKERFQLESELKAAQAAVVDGERRLGGFSELEQRKGALFAREQRIQQANQQLEQVKDKGSACRATLEQLTLDEKRLVQQAIELKEKQDLLVGSSEPNCPLCTSPLGEDKQRDLIYKFEQDRVKLEAEQGLLQQKRCQLEQEIEGLRGQYQELQKIVKELPEVQRQIADCDAELSQLRQLASEQQARCLALTKLEQALRTANYAHAEKKLFDQYKLQIDRLGYDLALLGKAKQELRELQCFELEKERLAQAYLQQEKLREQIEVQEQQLGDWQARLQQGDYALSEHEQMSKLVAELERVAYSSELHQQIDAECRRLAPVVTRYQHLALALERASSLKQQLQSRRQEKAGATEELTSHLERHEQILQELQRMPSIEAQLASVSQQIRQARTEESLAVSKKAASQAGVERCQQANERSQELAQELATLRRERHVYEKLAIAFGKDGIPALIIENAIPEIEELANDILFRLTAGKARITIEALRDKKSGGTKETLDIRISDELGTRDYELFSGGEAFRCNFAIRIALSKMLARRAGTRLQTLVIDEGFGTQDAEGLEHMVEAIQTVREDFEKILVVTHLEALKNAFPVRIEVNKQPEVGSQLRVVHL